MASGAHNDLELTAPLTQVVLTPDLVDVIEMTTEPHQGTIYKMDEEGRRWRTMIHVP
jgi:hypothetical protein